MDTPQLVALGFICVLVGLVMFLTGTTRIFLYGLGVVTVGIIGWYLVPAIWSYATAETKANGVAIMQQPRSIPCDPASEPPPWAERMYIEVEMGVGWTDNIIHKLPPNQCLSWKPVITPKCGYSYLYNGTLYPIREGKVKKLSTETVPRNKTGLRFGELGESYVMDVAYWPL